MPIPPLTRGSRRGRAHLDSGDSRQAYRSGRANPASPGSRAPALFVVLNRGHVYRMTATMVASS
jgi:hypothetical protein